MKRKFLLVDDDYEDAHIFRETLEKVDPDVLCYYALHGQDALDKLEGQEIAIPDMIFLDINMPAMDGWEFLQKYEAMPEAHKSSIIVIMLTTSFNPGDELKARQIKSVKEFRNKPLTSAVLQDILKRHFPDNC